ncbi:hypothetical protein F4808DRAFT_442490 [Astrocystis sublimbata]|nr:hypothetical protein F4808DRAFT_442490 [Astrocystis sublimbata]
MRLYPMILNLLGPYNRKHLSKISTALRYCIQHLFVLKSNMRFFPTHYFHRGHHSYKTREIDSSRTSSHRNSDNKVEQTFPAKRINDKKLFSLLDREFDNDYSLKLRSDQYTVSTPRWLSTAEIESCAARRYRS